jgi:methylmalonyl-CoA mutase
LTVSPEPLAASFEAASRGDWLALVERTLKGADVETLATAEPDGVVIEPLYSAEDRPRGFPPAARAAERPWDIRAQVRRYDPKQANAEVREDLAGGAHSAILSLDQPGRPGVAVASAADLAEALAEVLVDIAPIALDAGFLGPQSADWLSAVAKGSPAAPLALHLDPLSAFAEAGASPGPIEAHLAAAAATAVRLAEKHPAASLFLASGRIVHEAGGGAVEELATMLAAAVAYLRALEAAGLHPRAAGDRLVLGLSIDADLLISTSKLRAARLLWARIARLADLTERTRIEARASRRMLTTAEAWTNLIRLTAAGAAAAIGGADAVVLEPFTDPLGPPTAFARRMARNTQLILMEEGRLGDVADPVGGAGAFEAVSRDLAERAWRRFTAIETAGGLASALAKGLVAERLRADRQALAASLATGERTVLGVTDYRAGVELQAPEIGAPEIRCGPAPEARLPGPDSACPALVPIRLEALAS